jgi:hypothetical protein
VVALRLRHVCYNAVMPEIDESTAGPAPHPPTELMEICALLHDDGDDAYLLSKKAQELAELGSVEGRDV